MKRQELLVSAVQVVRLEYSGNAAGVDAVLTNERETPLVQALQRLRGGPAMGKVAGLSAA